LIDTVGVLIRRPQLPEIVTATPGDAAITGIGLAAIVERAADCESVT